MKQQITIIITIITLVFFSSCTIKHSTAPSLNNALNKISNSQNKATSGILQNNLDNWLQNKWTPTVNKDNKIQKKYLKQESISHPVTNTTDTNCTQQKKEKYIEDPDRDFTLQEYVDKASAYMKAHPSDDKDSHVKKLESMPVIGK